MKIPCVFHSFSVLTLLACFNPTIWVDGGNITALFVFGDSIADVGTNKFVRNGFLPREAESPPYGETFLNMEATGRWSDGKLIPDFIAEYLNLPSPPPYLRFPDDAAQFVQGASFASFGSGILDITGQALGVVGLSAQLQQFQDVITKLEGLLGEKATVDILDHSVFLIISGSNDLVDYWVNPWLQVQYPHALYVELLASNLEKQIQLLIEKGAQKLMVGGLGPLGCTPFIRGISFPFGECGSQLNNFTGDLNAKNSASLDRLNSQFSSPKIIQATIYDIVMDLINNAGSQGFTACCGSGFYNGLVTSCGLGFYSVCSNVKEHLFWDFIHPTEKLYQLLAGEIWAGGIDVMQPMNLSQLVQA